MNNLPFVCPNCGSPQVHKSLGGKVENFLALGVTKFAKSQLMGDYGRLTGGVENQIIKDEVPFQYVCDYCHYTFHARKSKIEAGVYSMEESMAYMRMETYNQKLQAMKDQEVKELKDKAFRRLIWTIIHALVLSIGIYICCNCEHTTEGLWGTTVYTGTFVFSWFVIMIGGISTLISTILCTKTYSKASYLENMSLQDYAREHSA